MTAIKLAAAMIRVFEGCKLNAYWDPTGKVWSIGYGHTDLVKQGDTCTAEQAERWLEQDMRELLYAVNSLPLLQQAALLSFGYNCGLDDVYRVIHGELLVSEEGFTVAKSGLAFGNVSGGKRLPGLVARRKLEAALYLAGSAE